MQLYTRRRRSGFRLPVSAAFLDFYTSSLFCKSEKMDSISRIQLFVKLNMRDRLLFIAAASVLALLQLGFPVDCAFGNYQNFLRHFFFAVRRISRERGN